MVAESLEHRDVTERWTSPRSFWIVLSLIVLVKAVILALNGVSLLPDSPGYIVYADAILDHTRAFAPVAWGAEAAPLFIFKPPGYPLVLAAAKLISPSGFMTVAVAGQILVNGVAIYLMFVTAARLLRSSRAALAAVVLYAGSTSILWDNVILSDSLLGSLWNIVIFVLIGELLGCWRLTIARSVALGLLWGAAIWVREIAIYFTALPLALIVLAVGREWRRSGRPLAWGGAFLLMVSGMAGGIVLLNLHRTGEPVFSIVGVKNWLHPGFKMAGRGYAQPFTDDGLVSTTVRETATGFGYEDQLQAIDELHRRCGCTPTQLLALVFDSYRTTVERFPFAYARVVISNFNYWPLGELIADPMATLNQFLELAAGRPEWRIPGLSLRNIYPAIQHLDIAKLTLMVLSAVAEVVSAIVFTVYMVGTPIALWFAARRREFTIAEAVIGFLWFSFVGVSLAFSLVHYEARHALPLLPGAAIGTVWILTRILAGRGLCALTPFYRRGR